MQTSPEAVVFSGNSWFLLTLHSNKFIQEISECLSWKQMISRNTLRELFIYTLMATLPSFYSCRRQLDSLHVPFCCENLSLFVAIEMWRSSSCAVTDFSMALPAHSGPRPLIQFRNHFYVDDRTPWPSNQSVARPLPKHMTTQTHNKRIYTSNIHASSGIRTHDPGVRVSEGSSCIRPRGYFEQRGNR
jgi:hypothetical protein